MKLINEQRTFGGEYKQIQCEKLYLKLEINPFQRKYTDLFPKKLIHYSREKLMPSPN